LIRYGRFRGVRLHSLGLAAVALVAPLGCSSGAGSPGTAGLAGSSASSSGNAGGPSTSFGGSQSSEGAAAGSGGAAAAVGGAGAGNAGGVAVAGGGGTSSSNAGSGGSGNQAGSGGSGNQAGAAPLGAVSYRQTFDALSPGLWKKNLDGAKIKAHPENAQVTAACGPDGSSCYRVVYRAADGIHKQPPSSPVFATTGSVIDWAASDADHTNTATDVTQANIHIDGSTDGASSASAKAVPSEAYTLSYDLYFEPGFDFAKGGKLPGLAAGEFDSGCSEEGSSKRQPTNWSERLMWRANGRVQLYSYDQSRASGSCGVEVTIDQQAGDPEFELPGTIPADDKFRFEAGTWYSIRLSVRVNDNDSVKYRMDGNTPVLDAFGQLQPVSGNGEVSLAIKPADARPARLLVFRDVALRDECNGPCPSTVPNSKETWVTGIFFSTFFGGNETKRTTCVDVASSTLQVVVPAQPPSYPGLTQDLFDTLCASQKKTAIYPKLTWNPQTPSAARFDNFEVREGYTSAAP